ncbi:MAG: Asp23/Gls24 family envelope stress response protein [Limnochordaceae bacterium]|uniref:Asp23/Gls24 family envelope stress response protein n=1 Tax=Carboxydichorda subterranea TaxID=3109565 RepID=A0ABZ1C0J7_9FIRM|nr:Asp23/Gls24 family envelope stress response protein [Limnochorda sp. L945t]MBE3598070.1 Asp23/Gls24 family envelope stress response protein [Limnochordaceae bacterium]WRP18408.1 Asp23/Gls24 family envelope stress response protein [Limnochorda sp. L945t]
MAVTLTNELGSIRIAEEALSAVAGYAARECYGIVGVAARSVPDGIAELLGLENVHRGVEVRLEDDVIVVNLFVMVEYGVNIFQVARNVMQQVKHRLEQISGLEVGQINVHVQGVRVGEGDRRRRHSESSTRRV